MCKGAVAPSAGHIEEVQQCAILKRWIKINLKYWHSFQKPENHIVV